MLAQIKASEDPCNTFIKSRTLEQSRRKYQYSKSIYYFKQKSLGLLMGVIGIIVPILLDGDITFSSVALPLGIYLMVTKTHVMDF